MKSSGENICEHCKIGYHAPFDRFHKIAAIANGPTFLQQCKICGSLWHETLHDARIVSISQAISLYPEAKLDKESD